MKDELFDVSGKICIVTGGLGQIGKNMARELYERDARVAVFAAHPTPERIEKTFPDHDPERLKFYKVDINQKNTIEAALDEMQQTWGDAPDVLVNCAGIDTQPSAPPRSLREVPRGGLPGSGGCEPGGYLPDDPGSGRQNGGGE